MFSTAQMDLIRPLVESMYQQGYKYYVVHTNTNLENYTNYDYKDLSFYFAKAPITFDSYTFTCSSDVVCIDAISRNVSSSTSDSKLPRLERSTMSSMRVTVNSYEHIMTNAENSYYGDLMAMTEYANQNDVSYNLDLNNYYVIPVMIGVIIIMLWFKMWFARNVGDSHE